MNLSILQVYGCGVMSGIEINFNDTFNSLLSNFIYFIAYGNSNLFFVEYFCIWSKRFVGDNKHRIQNTPSFLEHPQLF